MGFEKINTRSQSEKVDFFSGDFLRQWHLIKTRKKNSCKKITIQSMQKKEKREEYREERKR